jgi:hypothetical protein
MMIGGVGDGEFDLAHDVALDSTGAIYAAEIKNWPEQSAGNN